MRILFSILLVISTFHPVISQEYKLVNSIEGFTGGFTTDPLGNIYHYSGGDLTRYLPDGSVAASFSSRDYGDITYVDAANPMKILVVYAKFSRALVLDAALSANFTLDLALFADLPPKWICLSRQEGFWVFDPSRLTVKKLNDQQQIVLEGTPLSSVVSSLTETGGLFDTGNWILLDARGGGVVVFDRFGTYYKTISGNFSQGMQVRSDNELMFKEGDHMVIYDIQKGSQENFMLPPNDPTDKVRVEQGRIFIRKQHTLEIYSF